MRSDKLLDLIEELGLNERQTIGTLLNEVESLEASDIDDDSDESEELDSEPDIEDDSDLFNE